MNNHFLHASVFSEHRDGKYTDDGLTLIQIIAKFNTLANKLIALL